MNSFYNYTYDETAQINDLIYFLWHDINSYCETSLYGYRLNFRNVDQVKYW